MALVYATLADMAGYAPAGTKLPDATEAVRVLTSASKFIRRATKTAIYDVDVDGYPTDAKIRQAFRDATCAQALWWKANPGEETGQAGMFSNISIGSLSLSRTNRGSSGGSSNPGPQLASQAETELRDAGVLAGSIVASYPWEGWR
jgi:hypothetical protein